MRAIRKCYGSNVVLDIEELTIVGGRLYTLIGGNGTGKSTLLSILAFLSPPTAGEIFYAGERVDWDRGSMEERRRRVTLLHQAPYLFGGTVYANVAFGLKTRGILGEEQRRIVETALEIGGLQGPVGHYNRRGAAAWARFFPSGYISTVEWECQTNDTKRTHMGSHGGTCWPRVSDTCGHLGGPKWPTKTPRNRLTE